MIGSLNFFLKSCLCWIAVPTFCIKPRFFVKDGVLGGYIQL